MDLSLWFKAVLIGLSIAAPVGPIGMLCIQRTLAHGQRIGLASGLGAALADACYGAIGAFGLQAVTQRFLALQTPLMLGGSVFLLWMAWGLWRSARPDDTHACGPTATAPMGTAAAMGSVFVLTLANPSTILSFMAVFAALGAGAPPGPATATLMVAGVFTGSALWWWLLSAGVHALRARVGPSWRAGVNRLSALCLLAFALWTLAGMAATG